MELQVEDREAFATTGGRALDPAQQSVLLVHGAGMDHSVWALQTRYFAHHGYNVLAVDLPGHGRSQGPARETVGDMADWLIAFLDAAKIDRATVVGHSMGSLIALDLAARYPDRIDAIILMGTAMPMMVSEELLAAAKANDHSAIDMITTWGYGRGSHLGGHKAPGLRMTTMAERLLERAADGVLYTDLNACNNYDNGLETASEVRKPVLLVLGGQDRMTPPRAAKALSEAIPDARTVVVEGCGHLMMVEKPDQILDTLKEAI